MKLLNMALIFALIVALGSTSVTAQRTTAPTPAARSPEVVLASGMSVAEIVDAYPTLSEDAVQGALRELAHEKEAAAA